MRKISKGKAVSRLLSVMKQAGPFVLKSRSMSVTSQMTLSGGKRIASSDRFSLNGTGAGGLAARTTTSTTSAITSSVLRVTATLDELHMFNEAMAVGSAQLPDAGHKAVDALATAGIDQVDISVGDADAACTALWLASAGAIKRVLAAQSPLAISASVDSQPFAPATTGHCRGGHSPLN